MQDIFEFYQQHTHGVHEMLKALFMLGILSLFKFFHGLMGDFGFEYEDRSY